MKTLYLLDAYALIFRAYYALIRAPRFTSAGFNTSAIFGFVNTLQELLRKENPSHIAVCFDPPGPTFRHEKYEGYKAERAETPEDIKLAVPIIKEILQAYRIPIIEKPGYEADDVIGTLATMASKRGYTTYMVTPDKDFGQLVTDNIFIFKPGYRGEDPEIRGVQQICEKYSLESPCQVIDLLALMGDKVDNIPGCPGVGETTAIKLIKQFGTVENMLQNTQDIKGALRMKVENNAENIRFSKFLATIITDVPIDFNDDELQRHPVDREALKKIFERLEFRTLMQRIVDVGTSSKNPNPAIPEESAKKNVSGQPSLFDFVDDGEDVVPEIKPLPQSNYRRLTEEKEIDEFVEKALISDEIGYAFICEGLDSMTAIPAGVAFSLQPGNGVYVDIAEGVMSKIARIFSSRKTVKAGVNTKFDLIVLRRHGCEFSAPYFDATIAHYLLQPEQRHSIDHLARTILHIEMSTREEYFDKKGLLTEAGRSNAWQLACETADMSLRLRAPLVEAVTKENMLQLLDDIELPLVEVLADMEYTGVAVDTRTLKEISRQLTARLAGLEKEIYELAGVEFNISSPAKVGEVLFDRLKIDEKAKKTKSGQYSTTEEILVKLAPAHPIVAKILELRGVKKLLTTYVNSLPEMISPIDGRIHTTYNQTTTATGRISSTNPNLQNIPIRTDDGREIRRAFIPAPGNLFFSADYSQIELRLVADLSGDESMIAAFLEDEDIHRATAAKIYHVSPQEVTDNQRRHAKTANFGILYGISAFGLAERLNIPRREAKQLIDEYFLSFPSVHKYMNDAIEEGKQNGYVVTKYNRRRMLPDINSRNAVVRGYNERNAINAPIQGTAADIIKLAMVRIFHRMNSEGLKTKMIMQVHDELNFDMVPSESERVTRIVTEEMQGVYHGRVPMVASWGVGENWLEAH